MSSVESSITLLQLLWIIVATMIFDRIVETMSLDVISVFDNIVVFVIPFVPLVTS